MTVTEESPLTSWAESSARADALRAQSEQAAADAAAARQLAAAEAAPKIAAAQARADRIKREEDRRRREEEAADAAQTEATARRERAVRRWRIAALSFAAVCGVVSLPFQMMALGGILLLLAIVPLVLEGLAWVLLSGAAAAIEEGRPAWHYRAGALLGAVFAATVNWLHGSSEYGMVAGAAAAFTSLAGPVVWDLHEHGRIAKKAGKVSRRERRRQEKAAKAEAEEKAAKAAEEKVRREAAKAAEETAAKELAAAREEAWPTVWERAQPLAAALGSVCVSDQVWRRAWYDVHGTELGETPETIAARVTVRAAVLEAVTDAEGDLLDGAEPLSAGMPKAPRSLARKGKTRSAEAEQKAPVRPLTEADLAPVRALAADLGGADQLSIAKIRKAVGGGNTTRLQALRDAVQADEAAV